MKRTHKLSLGLAAVLLTGTMLSGCNNAPATPNTPTTQNNNTQTANQTADPQTQTGASEETTIKILFKGPKTDGFDDVYAEYLNRTKDTLNINLDFTFVEHADYKEKLNLEITSGTDYDLVFEAPWVHLRNLSADGYYADLREYFNNDAYPGLKKAFSESIMENNLWFDRMCYIPLFRAYGNGIHCIHYRQDWADEWGIGQIDSYEKMEQYWDKAKENSILPLSATNTRGFFQLFTIAGYFPGAAEAGIMSFDLAGASFMVYVKDGKLVSIAPQGAGDEAFKDFPEGWNRDFAMDRFERFAEWNKKGYLSPDSLTITDANTPFWSGQAASVIGTLDDVENMLRNFPDYSPEAVLGEFIYDEGIRNMQPGSIPTTFAGNNGLCVPEASKNKDAVMRFLDWLFAEQENHDLFELGILDKDYTLNDDGTFTSISTYPANWPGYAFTWNSNYVTFSDLVQGKVREYREYERTEEACVIQPITGFAFNGADVEVASYVAQTSAVGNKVGLTKLHGILSDGTNTYNSAREMMRANLDECYDAGLQFVQDELARQIEEHLAKAASKR